MRDRDSQEEAENTSAPNSSCSHPAASQDYDVVVAPHAEGSEEAEFGVVCPEVGASQDDEERAIAEKTKDEARVPWHRLVAYEITKATCGEKLEGNRRYKCTLCDDEAPSTRKTNLGLY